MVGKKFIGLALLALMSGWGGWASAQLIAAPYNSVYSFVDLGAAPGVPAPYGGITFKVGDLNKVLLGGSANNSGGVIDMLTVTRGLNQHVTGFSGTATQVSTAPGHTFGGIDGKTVTKMLTEEQACRYQPWFDNAADLRRIVRELQNLSVSVFDQREP